MGLLKEFVVIREALNICRVVGVPENQFSKTAG